MITYIINFVVCSGLLLLVYRAFLGHENLYRFNRFYLLFSLVFSLIVPVVTIHIPYTRLPAIGRQIIDHTVSNIIATPAPQPVTGKQVSIVADKIARPQATAATISMAAYHAAQPSIADQTITTAVGQANHEQILQTPGHNYLPDVLLTLYGIATLIMLLRFARNSYQISSLVTKNTIVNYQDSKLVLVDDEVTPHSFLKYIFINKQDYHNELIEPEIICHEQTHVRQLHSLDVILVELLQVVFWFNPFIPFYRNAIQLNHEFLADEAVIENYQDTPAYQYLLLAKASQSGSLCLTSQFNYSVTKNRLIMMSKTTSAATAWVARLAVIPVITIAFLLFCNKTVAALKSVSHKKTDRTIKANVVNKDTSTKKHFKFGPPIFRINYPSTKKGAPTEILKEYTAIASKYYDDSKYANQSRHTKAPAISQTDRKKLEMLFRQMSAKQQKNQKIAFSFDFKYPLIIPTQAQLDSCMDNKLYGVSIDFKRVKAADLEKHQPEEFSYFKKYKLRKAEYKWTKYHYSISLMTNDYFNTMNKSLEGSRIFYTYKNSDGFNAQRMF